MQPKVATEIINNQVIYRRFIEAPVELVFAAWSEPERLAKWWGPDGFTLSTQAQEFAKGGFWIFIMHGPDGHDYKNKIQYLEIDRPRLISYRHLGDGEEEPNVQFLSRITFAPVKGGTDLTMTQEFPSKAELERVEQKYGAIKGGQQHVENLATYLKTAVQAGL